MYEFQKKKKIVDLVFYVCVSITLSFMLIAPLFGTWFKENNRLYSDISVIFILITVVSTFYFSRYKKAGLYVARIAAEIQDCGYYITLLSADTLKDFETAVYNNLSADFFSVYSDVKFSERDFSLKAEKKKNTLYFARCKRLTKEDWFAYCDAVTSATASANVRQKQTVVLAIAAEQIDDAAIAYSKMTTALGKIMIYPLFVDIRSNRAYFFQDGTGRINFALKNVLGYKESKIPVSCAVKEQLPFQKELEKKMLLFTAKAYREGKFNPRA